MIVYRLSKKVYVEDLSGLGSRLFGGRWNPKGVSCVYASTSVSLALLERFVHAQGTEDMNDLMLLRIELPDEKELIYHMDETKFKNGWQFDFDYSQWLGQQVLRERSILGFSVPSAIVACERNVIVNPMSLAMSKIKILGVELFNVDPRLFIHLPKSKKT